MIIVLFTKVKKKFITLLYETFKDIALRGSFCGSCFNCILLQSTLTAKVGILSFRSSNLLNSHTHCQDSPLGHSVCS